MEQLPSSGLKVPVSRPPAPPLGPNGSGEAYPSPKTIDAALRLAFIAIAT